jgi:S1-C subfamily serine protease
VLLGVAAALVAVGCGGSDERGEPADSVVAIRASGCRPTPTRAVGVVVDDDLLATVAHAVAGESEITVATPDGRRMRGEVAAIDTALDAALIRVDGLELAPLPRRVYDDAESVTVWTNEDGPARPNPVEVRRRVTVRTSDIYREGEHLRPGLELQAELAAGDSGGGLVGTDDELLAMVWATSRERDDRAWALPIEAVDPLLAAARDGVQPAPARCAR